MKQFAKRGLSMLLALTMCLSLLAGMTFTASAASYTYNWGQRGTVADEDDFTRSTAEEWYAKCNVEYSELAQLSGSSSTSSVPGSSLYTELKSLMTSAHSYKTSYEDTKKLYQYTDCQNGGGKISSFYSGTAIGPGWGDGGSWNREHTWPNSKGLGGQDENDIMMLRPTASSENSSRGNTAYGEGSSYYDPNDESGGTYNLHGDVARIVLYVYTRWGNTSYMWGTAGVMESKEVLLKWMEEDPVDTWELGRNDAVQSITGTRNVFVDYPELAFTLFGAEVPDNYQTPSGEGNAVSYNITATSNNTSYGTVSLSGKTITATPKTGYYASGYTVTSGSATVTQSGNTFRVSPSSDCSVMINFAPKTAVKLTFMENGTVGSTIASYGGDSVTLPSNKNTPADGYTFVGWTDTVVADTTTKPTIYTAGTTVTASNKTYYALYSWVDGENSSSNWQLVTDTAALRAGDQYIMAYNAGAKVAGGLDGKFLKPLDATFSADLSEITKLPDGAVIFTLGGSTGAWTFANEAGEQLGSSSEKTMTFGTGSNWTITITNGEAVIKTNAGTLQYNTGAPRFTTYSNSSQKSLNLYSMGGTVYYTTSTVVCEHENTTDTAAVAATCSATGYTAGVYCNDCDQYISGHEVVAALGHSWGDWVQTTAPTCTVAGVETATCSRCSETKTQSVPSEGHDYEGVVTKPTETQQGYTTYTCLTCGDSYVDDYTEALGETFYVSFSVPADVTAIATVECGKNGITLPTADAPEGYSFLGWTTASLEDTTEKPEILTGAYNATHNVTLYALYSYVEGGTGETGYVKVTTAPSDWSGQYVIVYETGSNVFNGSLTSLDAKNNHKTVTITDNTIAAADGDLYYVTIAEVDGGYSIQTVSGYYVGATSNSNSLNSSTTTVYTNTLSMNDDGTVNVIGSGGAYLRFNSGDSRFRYYKSSSYTNQKAIALYAKIESGTTYYTTLTAEPDPVAAVNGVEYTSFEEAYAAATGGQTVKLLATVGENAPIAITMDRDLYVDLNGWYLYAAVTANGYTIYGMDSCTDGYDADEWGCLNVTGATVAPITNNSYLAVDEGENSWSFHAYAIKLTYVSLDPTNDALGYKAQFFGDEMVRAHVTGFGFYMGVEGGQQKTYSTEAPLANGQVFTLRLKNIMKAKGGEMNINASAFVTFDTVEEPIASAEHSTSMKDVILAVNAVWDTASYTAVQKTAVKALYTTYSTVMDTWFEGVTNNISAWTPETTASDITG